MNKLFFIFTYLIFSSSLYSQESDSLQILKSKDWFTLEWLEKDTVYLFSKAKIDTIYDGLSLKDRIRKKRRNKYGERISFESGEVKYTDYAICKVGDPLRKITSFIFKKNKIFVEFQSIQWPYKDKEWVLKKREFEILKWSSDRIVLK